MQRPLLEVKVRRRLENNIIVEVDGPEALAQWCLELALLLTGHSPSFTALSTGEWKGKVWFGLDRTAEDEERLRWEGDRLLIFAPRSMVDQWLHFCLEHYRKGRIRFDESDWGSLTLKLSGPAWREGGRPITSPSRHHRR